MTKRELEEELKKTSAGRKFLEEAEPCEDCVSRKAVHNMLEDIPIVNTDKWFNWLQKACLRLADMPSVTPTRKQGKWIKEYDNSALDGLYHCSVCGRKLWILKEQSASDYPYCHCGAEMSEV